MCKHATTLLFSVLIIEIYSGYRIGGVITKISRETQRVEIKALKQTFLFHNAFKKLVKKKVVFSIFYKEKPSLKSIFADS